MLYKAKTRQAFLRVRVLKKIRPGSVIHYFELLKHEVVRPPQKTSAPEGEIHGGTLRQHRHKTSRWILCECGRDFMTGRVKNLPKRALH